MRKILTFLFAIVAAHASAQKKIVENPRIDFYKQTITIYTDSAFKSKKEISTGNLKFTLLEWKNNGWKALKRGLSSQPIETVYIKDGQFIKTPKYREVLESYDPAFKKKHEAYYQKLIKTYGKRIGNGIYFGTPVIGMNSQQFFMCRDWPDDRNVTETASGTREQFVYRDGDFGTKYYYFTNNKLTAIQD